MKLSTRLAYSLFPASVWSLATKEWKLTKVRFRNSWHWRYRQAARRFATQQHLKIHLGCGDRFSAGWINVDAIQETGIELTWDLRRPLPFSSGSACMIYSEHVLEHLEEPDALRLLAECHRILEPAGAIRLGVPDAELYLGRYAAGDSQFFERIRHLGGAVVPLSTPMRVINQMFRMGGHHLFAWDFLTLEDALRSVGFGDVKRCVAGTSERPELCLDDPSHAFETLYVEACKA